MIDIEEFKKIDLRIGEIVEVKEISGAKKPLYLLKILLGKEEKQSIAGLGETYSKEELIGKKVVVVANLKPKKILGELSEVMVLAAIDKGGKPILIVPDRDIHTGARVL